MIKRRSKLTSALRPLVAVFRLCLLRPQNQPLRGPAARGAGSARGG
jgi:hypothetical protein